jgi:hypothetical protein
MIASFHGKSTLLNRRYSRAEAAFLVTECKQETFCCAIHFSCYVAFHLTADRVSDGRECAAAV